MTQMLEFDADAADWLVAMYTTPDIVAQRATVLELLDLRAGERVLDVGVGPALLAAQMAEAVGPTGAVHGIDVSEQMLAAARNRVAQLPKGHARVALVASSADAIPYLDESFDVVVSTQVFEYVPDIPAALAEVRRVLRPGGRLLLLDTDWDSIVWHSTDRDRMARVLATWERHLADPYLPRRLPAELRTAGFHVAPPIVVPLLNVGFEERTFSAGLIGLVGSYVEGRDGWSADAVGEWRDDLRSLAAAYFFSLNRYVFCARKPD